jgi:hypothetical protein
MGKMKELYLNQQQATTGSGDEDYIYEQYLANEKMNEEYWAWQSTQAIESIFPPDMEYDDEYYKSTYTPTIEEQMELDELLKKQNGHT